jgi:hypothetical protein
VLIAVLACALLGAGCDWAQWGGNAARSSFNLEPELSGNNAASHVVSTAGPAIEGQAVLADGLLFAQTSTALLAIDPHTYGRVWTGTLPAGASEPATGPAVDVASRTVFAVVATAQHPVLVGFDLDGVRNCNLLLYTCAPIFRADLGTSAGPATPPAIDGGKVFANGAGSLYAFDANGATNCTAQGETKVCNPLWSATTGYAAAGIGPAVANGLVHVPVQNGGTYGVHAFDVFDLARGTTRQIRTVDAPIDFHELRPLPNGNVLLMSYSLTRGIDLTGVPATPPAGPNSTVADCELQELNPQGQLVWQWKASDHIDAQTETTFNSTAQTINGEMVYDVYHCNSIDITPAGDILVSARHLNAVWLIDRPSGVIAWKMGATAVNKDGAQILAITNYGGASLALQHDARWLANGNVSIFDNQWFMNRPARGVEFDIDLVNSTARAVFVFQQPNGISSVATGTFRRYSDGHSLVGWGITAFGGNNDLTFTEVNATGNAVVDMRFASGDASYRVVKAPTTQFDIDVLRATAGK